MAQRFSFSTRETEYEEKCPDSLDTGNLVDVDLDDHSGHHDHDIEQQSVHLTMGVSSREMMGEHNSYHQSISGVEARRRLRAWGEQCCYLTRYSETWRSYVLTVHQKQRPHSITKHFKIVVKNGRHKIDGKEDEFGNIATLLKHYEQNRLDPAFETIGQAYSFQEYKRKKCVVQ